MGTLPQILDLLVHLNRHLEALVSEHGAWIYGLLFLIVFCETGLVVTPFLPEKLATRFCIEMDGRFLGRLTCYCKRP